MMQNKLPVGIIAPERPIFAVEKQISKREKETLFGLVCSRHRLLISIATNTKEKQREDIKLDTNPIHGLYS